MTINILSNPKLNQLLLLTLINTHLCSTEVPVSLFLNNQSQDKLTATIKPEPDTKPDPYCLQGSSPHYIEDLRRRYTRFTNFDIVQPTKSSFNSKTSNIPYKKVRFNKIAEMFFVRYHSPFKLNLAEPTKCRKRTLLQREIIKVNSAISKTPRLKFRNNNTEPYIDDEISDDNSNEDPPVLITNITKLKPKLTLNPPDCVYDSTKAKPKDGQDLPLPTKLVIHVDPDDEQAHLDHNLLLEDHLHPLFQNQSIIPFDFSIPALTEPYLIKLI